MTQNNTATTRPRLATQASRARWLIAVLLFVTVVINYMDRANLSIAMPAIADEMDLSKAQQGLLLSAFGWTYAALQIPGGWLVDRIRPRVLYPLCLALWSLATVFMGVIGGFVALIALRLLVGIFEAPAYPINNRVATAWFPERERASVIGFYTSGQFIGLALLTPVLSWLQSVLSWHWVFIVTGAIGLLWAAVWYSLYREPRESRANDAEIELIAGGGGLVDVVEAAPTRRRDARRRGDRARQAQVVGHLPGPVLPDLDAVVLPDLVPDVSRRIPRHGLHQDGVPGVAAVHRGARRRAVLRRLLGFPAAARCFTGYRAQGPDHHGLLLTMAMLGANFTDSTAMVVVFLSIAFFGNGLASITWSLVSALAPSGCSGSPVACSTSSATCRRSPHRSSSGSW